MSLNDRALVLAVARLLEAAARGEEPVASEGEAATYAELLRTLGPGTDVPGTLRGHEFRPFLLLNGLLHAGRVPEAPRRWILAALADALTAFADYFAFLVDRDPTGFDAAALERLQRRYFAWCVAQLGEAGMELDGIFLTMKGDTLDQGSSMQVRLILDEGPAGLLASDLYTDAEKVLWERMFAGDEQAWPALRDLLVATWEVPFRAPPADA
jgi:hypothetical protein